MLTLQRSVRTPACRSVAAVEYLRAYDDWGWLGELEHLERDWRRRLRWIDLVDRLAVEEPRLEDAETYADDVILSCDPLSLGLIWREAWRRYVEAAHRYRHRRRVDTLADHYELLTALGGNRFCMLPGVDFRTRRAIARFGALDRFFTNLRDLNQDLRRGVQCFPGELLERFGLCPRDLVSHKLRSHPGYLALMRFWMDDYLPSLRDDAAEFSHCDELPLGLDLMRKACEQRHARIETAFRECGLHFPRAEAAYWREVERLREVETGEVAHGLCVREAAATRAPA